MPSCPLCSDLQNVVGLEVPNYFHCAQCDLRFLQAAKRLDSAAEKARYLHHNNDPNDHAYRNFLRPLVNAIAPHLQKGARGLDFGAGPGPTLAGMLEQQGFQMALYDPYFLPDLAPLQQTYDFVVASEVVEHFYSPGEEFQRLYRLLKPGGWLGLMTLLIEPETDFANWYYRRDPTHVVFYSRATCAWIAQHLGMVRLTYSGERIVLLQRPNYDNC